MINEAIKTGPCYLVHVTVLYSPARVPILSFEKIYLWISWVNSLPLFDHLKMSVFDSEVIRRGWRLYAMVLRQYSRYPFVENKRMLQSISRLNVAGNLICSISCLGISKRLAQTLLIETLFDLRFCCDFNHQKGIFEDAPPYKAPG